MSIYRVCYIVEVECDSAEEAQDVADQEYMKCKLTVNDVSDSVCCSEARASNGWRHNEDCRNWVLVY